MKGTPEKLNMVSTVTNKGQLRFMFYKETMTARLFISFLKRLIRGSRKKIFLIVDNLRVHHSKVVSEWLNEKKAFIEVFYLPSYSPELNPDELLNSTLKSDLGKKPDSKRKGELEGNAKAIMRSIQQKPQKVKNLFKKDTVRYAS